MDDHSETILIVKGQKQYANLYSVLTLAFSKKYTAAGKYGIHLLELNFWDCKHVCCYPGYYLFAHSYSLTGLLACFTTAKGNSRKETFTF